MPKGKPHMRPRRKNKKGKASTNAPTTHSFWSNIVNKPESELKPAIATPKVASILNNLTQSAKLQTPKQQSELIADLINDTAPNNPLLDEPGSVKQPEKEQKEQKTQKLLATKSKIFENQLIVNEKEQALTGLQSNYYEEEDFTKDLHDIDFSGNRNISSYNDQRMVINQDTTIYKPTKLNPVHTKVNLSTVVSANKPKKQVNIVNQPSSIVNQSIKLESNKPKTFVNIPNTSIYKLVNSVNQSITPSKKHAINVPNTSTPVPENSPIALANNFFSNKLMKMMPGDDVAYDFSSESHAGNTASTSTRASNVIGNSNTQKLNRTLQTVPIKPSSDISNSKYRGTMFNPLHPFSSPKGIPRSFLRSAEPVVTKGQQIPLISSLITNTMPKWPTQQNPNYPQQFTTNPQTMAYNQTYDNAQKTTNEANSPIIVQTEKLVDITDQYSPSESYDDAENDDGQEEHERSESPDLLQGSQKRLSAFKRLGPQAEPKKPKLTINLLCNKEQAVREVVDETEEKQEIYIPVHLREDMLSSKDDTVVKYLPLWPWKKNVAVRKRVGWRQSKSVMILEHEQMQDDYYHKENLYFQITIKGYPRTWKKNKVLDAILESVKDMSFIPIFIEFNENECKFFVIRCQQALIAIHKYGFVIRHDDEELQVSISHVDMTVKHLDFIPRLVMRKRLSMGYDGERKLNLNAFTLGNDISHFLYYPLHRVKNQTELVQLQSTIAWEYLTDLDLSHNRLTELQGFSISKYMPKLNHLNVSYNNIDKVTELLSCKEVPLTSLWLEGNPLCSDYTDPDHYVRVLKMMFPCIKEVDGTTLPIPEKLPKINKNYCPEDAMVLVNKFLEVFFPLLDSAFEHRSTIDALYDPDAILTITHNFKLRYGQVYRYYRSLFLRCRVIDEGEMESVEGSNAICKLITKWPGLKHDPFTFTVDVMYHDDNTTILRIGGIVKLTTETLAEDEHLLAFTRTVVLHSKNGEVFKIKNEMVYWDEPTDDYAGIAFKVTEIKAKPLSLKLESTPDDDLKEKLINIFMHLTDTEKEPSIKYLESKEWNLKNALEYFIKQLKLDSIESI